MKVIVAGSRTIDDYDIVSEFLNKFNFSDDDEIVHGGADGVDTLAGNWADKNSIDKKVFPAKWDKHGKGAGFIRNENMAKYGDILIAIWDGESNGTKDMIDKALDSNCNVHVYQPRD